MEYAAVSNTKYYKHGYLCGGGLDLTKKITAVHMGIIFMILIWFHIDV